MRYSQYADGRAQQEAPHGTAMHPDTAAAVRLLVLALENHPEDLEILQVYGDMGEHLADLVDDYLDDDE